MANIGRSNGMVIEKEEGAGFVSDASTVIRAG
jgi:hypothetical protein